MNWSELAGTILNQSERGLCFLFAVKTSAICNSHMVKFQITKVQSQETLLGLNYISCMNYEVHMNLLYAVRDLQRNIEFEAYWCTHITCHGLYAMEPRGDFEYKGEGLILSSSFSRINLNQSTSSLKPCTFFLHLCVFTINEM